MECPKCGIEIDDNAMVCPNCKKVLKLACPICKTVNVSNTCKKCGYVIISKCHNCGKINQTFSKKCKKCGFDTEKSIIMNEANSDDYVLMTIDFPNMNDMKRLLGSAKLFNKFKINLEKLITDYAKSIGVRRQIIDKTTVIRFTGDYTFNSTVNSAIKATIELLNQITALNCKLSGKKDATIRCKVFLLKRNIEDDPYNIDSGYNINLVNQNAGNKEEKILNTFQVIADNSIVEVIGNEYKTVPLDSVMINDEMVMFAEIDLKNFVKVEFPTEEDDDEIKVPNFVQNMLVEQEKLDGDALKRLDNNTDPDSIYDIETINFEEIRCDFIRTENHDAEFHIMNKFQSVPKGIVAIKTPELYKPYTLKLLNAAGQTGNFNNIISLTCYDEMKYAPYSFFRELVSAIFEYTVSQKLFFQNDFSMFANIDPDGHIADLVTLRRRISETSAESIRYVYFDIFLTLLQVIPKTLIFIEDFDKIDSSSYDVLKYLFGAFEQLDVSFLVSYDKSFSLHKDCHFLLMSPYYTEITLKPTSFEKLIEDNKIYFKNILSNFYFQRVAKYACGSSLFIDLAIQYLIESGVFAEVDNCIEMVNPKTIIIPSSLDKLVARRLNILQDSPEVMKFLTSIVLIGTRVDMATIDSLGYDNSAEILANLSEMGYVYEFNNCIYFPNYNLLKRNLLTTISKIYLGEVAQDLFDKVYNEADIPSTTEAYLYGLLGNVEREKQEWEELAEVNLSLGDFSAYINCMEKIIDILDTETDTEIIKKNKEYKALLFENISVNLYDYVPEKFERIAKLTLRNIEKTADTDKIIQMCNKMLMGSITAGDYNQALELMHKVLALLPISSINPADPNFNQYFFLMSVIHIQILFNIGALVDCLDVGYKVLNVVNDQTISALKPDEYSDEEFKTLIIDSAGFVAMANVLLMTGGVGEFLNILRNELSCVPKSYDLFIALQDLLKGNAISVQVGDVDESDRFGNTLINLIAAFTSFDGNYTKFAEAIYKAKIAAKENMLNILELFADLFIAYAYLQLNSYTKAEAIIYKIIRQADEKGLITILYAAWFVMSELQLKQNKYDVAFNIINNSLIQLEKENTSCEYILMLFKYNMFKVMMYKQQYEKAEICLGHAQYLAQKYGINFNFDTDTSHYVAVEEENDEFEN